MRIILVLLVFCFSYTSLFSSPYGEPTTFEEYFTMLKNGQKVTEIRLNNGAIRDVCLPASRYKELLQFKDLEILGSDTCSLEEIPEEVFQIKTLKSLIMINNKLINISKKIGDLINLEVLILSSNELVNLPDSIGRLVNLRKLDLEKNNLIILPENIGHLMNLEELDLSYNQIEYLPSSILNLVNMKYLEGAGNKFKKIEHMQLYFNSQGNRKGYMSYKSIWESPYAKEQYLNIFKKTEKLIIPEAYTITATRGLSVRDKPSLKAKKIGAMPHKLRIAVYEKSKNAETIDGITAPWMRIKAVTNSQYVEGWAWGGYLEKFVYTDKTDSAENRICFQ